MAFLWFLMAILAAVLLTVLMLGWRIYHALFGSRRRRQQAAEFEAAAQDEADRERLKRIKQQFKRMGEDVPYEDVHFEN